VEIREKVKYQGYKDQIDPPPQKKDEIWEIIRTLENNKSPTEDNVSAEMIKYWDKKL